jgi:hypothetical protein
MRIFWGKTGLPRHQFGAIARIDMEIHRLWQQVFWTKKERIYPDSMQVLYQSGALSTF